MHSRLYLLYNIQSLSPYFLYVSLLFIFGSHQDDSGKEEKGGKRTYITPSDEWLGGINYVRNEPQKSFALISFLFFFFRSSFHLILKVLCIAIDSHYCRVDSLLLPLADRMQSALYLVGSPSSKSYEFQGGGRIKSGGGLDIVFRGPMRVLREKSGINYSSRTTLFPIYTLYIF